MDKEVTVASLLPFGFPAPFGCACSSHGFDSGMRFPAPLEAVLK